MKAENEATATKDMQKELEEFKQRCKKLKVSFKSLNLSLDSPFPPPQIVFFPVSCANWIYNFYEEHASFHDLADRMIEEKH